MTVHNILNSISLILVVIPWIMYAVYWSRIPECVPFWRKSGGEVEYKNRIWLLATQASYTLITFVETAVLNPFLPLISDQGPGSIPYKWLAEIMFLILSLNCTSYAWGKISDVFTGYYSDRLSMLKLVLLVVYIALAIFAWFMHWI